MNKEKIALEAHKTIDNLFDKVTDLEQKGDELGKEVKHKFDEKIINLDKQKAELKEKYNKLKNASEDNWQEVMKSYNESLDNFKKGVREVELLMN
jgi:hypothetical protein